jgi:hypothetical protein
VQDSGPDSATTTGRYSNHQEGAALRDSKKRCQDWVFNTLISLEAEELVPSGMSEFWKGMVGKPARVVAQACGTKWIQLN